MRRRMAIVRIVSVLFGFVFMLVLSALAMAGAPGNITIGDFRLLVDDTPNEPLKRTAMGAATFAIAFARDVGGINFQATSQGTTSSPTLSYLSSEPDGRRFRITLNGTTLTAPLFDWQLKPIIKYADSDFTAVVSLFGSGPDRKHYFYIRYHPAFQDTLLGLRLVQTDMFLMDPREFRNVPAIDGHPILGPGEQMPDSGISASAAEQVAGLVKGKKPGSWVFTDVDVKVATSPEEVGALTLEGSPYYYFWHPILPTKMDVLSAVLEWKTAHPAADETQIKSQIKEIFNSKMQLTGDAEFTNLLRDKYALLLNSNPIVFQSARYVMQYAALFRQLKASEPERWEQFVQSVNQGPQLTPFRTPTRLARTQ